MAGIGSFGANGIRLGLKDFASLKSIGELHTFDGTEGPRLPLCYRSSVGDSNYLVISPGEDQSSSITYPDSTTRGIFDLITNSKTRIDVSDVTNVLIPVAITSRQHWVTVNYDKKTNTATIIDPRPWYVSFLWSNKNLKQEIQDGLVKIGLPIKDKPIKFSTIYQGIQHNDVTCGSWSLANIYAQISGKKLNEMGTVFSANDEPQVVKAFSPGVEKEKIYKPTLFTRIFQGALNFFGLSKIAQPDLINSFNTTAKAPEVSPAQSSYATMFTSRLGEDDREKHGSSSPDQKEDSADDFEFLETQSNSTTPNILDTASGKSAAEDEQQEPNDGFKLQ
jgi:hypothetical protein